MSNDPAARAARAQRLLEDEILTEALAMLESRAVDQWRNSEAHQSERRDDAYQRIRAIADLRSELQSLVNNGNIARRREERRP